MDWLTHIASFLVGLGTGWTLKIGLPMNLRHSPASRRGLFKGLGADTTQVAVTAVTVVEGFNVVEDVGAGHISGLVDSFTNPLLFQATKKRFCHGIIPAIATSAHAGL